MSPEGGGTQTERPVAPKAPAPENFSTPKSPKTSTPVSRQGFSHQTAPPPANRNGIPVIRPGDDLEQRLLDTEETDPKEDLTAADVSRPTGHALDRKKADIPSSPRARLRKPRLNRHGLPLLSDQDDLQAGFRRTTTNRSSSDNAVEDPPQRPDDCDRRDKHGIPVLDHCHDLGRLLEAASDEHHSDGDLGEALKRSIAHDARTLIKKKSDGYFPTRKLTLKERLKRYPRPQRQLDLHGLTAIQADQRAEAFILTAHKDGLLTLRIIVGKGLHSASGAVLPDVVEDLLNRLKRDGSVMTCRWDKGVKRKSGSIVVYLEAPF